MSIQPKVLRAKRAAEFLALSESTLSKMRMEPGAGPKFIKAGRTVLYFEEDLIALLTLNRRTSTRAL